MLNLEKVLRGIHSSLDNNKLKYLYNGELNFIDKKYADSTGEETL